MRKSTKNTKSKSSSDNIWGDRSDLSARKYRKLRKLSLFFTSSGLIMSIFFKSTPTALVSVAHESNCVSYEAYIRTADSKKKLPTFDDLPAWKRVCMPGQCNNVLTTATAHRIKSTQVIDATVVSRSIMCCDTKVCRERMHTLFCTAEAFGGERCTGIVVGAESTQKIINADRKLCAYQFWLLLTNSSDVYMGLSRAAVVDRCGDSMFNILPDAGRKCVGCSSLLTTYDSYAVTNYMDAPVSGIQVNFVHCGKQKCRQIAKTAGNCIIAYYTQEGGKESARSCDWCRRLCIDGQNVIECQECGDDTVYCRSLCRDMARNTHIVKCLGISQQRYQIESTQQ